MNGGCDSARLILGTGTVSSVTHHIRTWFEKRGKSFIDYRIICHLYDKRNENDEQKSEKDVSLFTWSHYNHFLLRTIKFQAFKLW